MIIGCVNVYNEEDLFPGCLESVWRQVDRLIVVDGAYADFPHDMPWSTDATREIARCYGAEVIECPPIGFSFPWGEGRAAWENEAAKRSAYFVGDEGDWYFVIDADERLVGALPDDLQAGHVYELRVEANALHSWAPRLFEHRGFMRYHGSHNAIWSDVTLVNHMPRIQLDAGQARLVHLAHLRPAERKRDKLVYGVTRREHEREYRARHGV